VQCILPVQAEAVAGHGQAAPAAGGPVQDGPHEGQAAGLAGEPADDLGCGGRVSPKVRSTPVTTMALRRSERDGNRSALTVRLRFIAAQAAKRLN